MRGCKQKRLPGEKGEVARLHLSPSQGEKKGGLLVKECKAKELNNKPNTWEITGREGEGKPKHTPTRKVLGKQGGSGRPICKEFTQ